jgi:hypothetical protein
VSNDDEGEEVFVNPYLYRLTQQHIADLRRGADASRNTAAMIRARAGSTLVHLGQRLLDGPANI